MYKQHHKAAFEYRRAPRGRLFSSGLRRFAAAAALLSLGFFLGASVSGRRSGSSGDGAFAELPQQKAPEARDTGPGTLFVPDKSAAPLPSDTPSPAEQESSPEKVTVRLPASVITVSVKGSPVEMELEDYLVGVVASEMSSSSEPDALRAQAIAARTFTALHMCGRASCKSGCTVCDDHRCCQAYGSESDLRKAWGSKYESRIEKIREAVRSTEGLVVTYDGKLISALYHASSGPATESSEEVFAVALPYLVSVDSREGDAEMVSKQSFPVSEVVEKLNSLYKEADLTDPLNEKDFDVWGRTPSGRVQLIRIGNSVITGSALRLALGLKSTDFTVEFDDKTVTFTCLGYGHGVGMSQVGANEMAKDGAGYAEILSHYYTGTVLGKLDYSP